MLKAQTSHSMRRHALQGVLLLLLGLCGLQSGWAAVFTVDSASNAAGANSDGNRTLRWAVAQAMATVGPHSVHFDPKLAGSTIELSGTVLTMGTAGRTVVIDGLANGVGKAGNLQAGEPHALGITIRWVSAHRFNVASSANVTFRGLAIGGVETPLSSSNSTGLIYQYNTARMTIEDCYIGFDHLGNDLRNGYRGVYVNGTGDVMIRNTAISNCGLGNAGHGGILIGGTARLVEIEGCMIGTDPVGMVAKPNSVLGVAVATTSTYVGGVALTSGANSRLKLSQNVISGNGGSGFMLTANSPLDLNLEGNTIGLNRTRTAAIGNQAKGLDLRPTTASSGTRTVSITENVIAANAGEGIFFYDTTTTTTNFNFLATIENNQIGTNAPGSDVDFGNGRAGIYIDDDTHHASGCYVIRNNTIAFSKNSGHGMAIAGMPGTTLSGEGIAVGPGSLPVKVLITENQIYGNAGLGIDLSALKAVTVNDPGDGDAGPNDLLNFPVINTASIAGSNLVISGWARPNNWIEFYLADQAGSGFRAGRRMVLRARENGPGDLTGTTGSYSNPVNGLNQGADTTNEFVFSVPVPAGVTAGMWLVATAHDADPTGGGGRTSEFSGSAEIVGAAGGEVNDYGDWLGNGDQMAWAKIVDFEGKLQLGQLIDGEPAHAGNSDATWDDLNGASDEDGLEILIPFKPGNTGRIRVFYDASPGGKAVAYLNAWADWNQDGDLDATTEWIIQNHLVTLDAGLVAEDFDIAVPVTAAAGNTVIRLRLNLEEKDQPPKGETLGEYGEVEDHLVAVTADGVGYDFGDYIHFDVAAQLASTDLFMGTAATDVEPDYGHANEHASGDDLLEVDDEDLNLGSFFRNQTKMLMIPVTANLAALQDNKAVLKVFVDWDGDRVFEGPEEQSEPVYIEHNGTHVYAVPIQVAVPWSGWYYMRIQLTEGSAEPDPFAINDLKGEVEDYKFFVNDCPTINLSNIQATGTVGGFYNTTVTGSGGDGPYSYAIVAGTRPPGTANINASTGQLSGTLSTAGTFNFTVRATDVHGCSGQRNYSVVVSVATPTVDYGDHYFSATSSAGQLASPDIKIGTAASPDTDAEAADPSDANANRDDITGVNDENLTMPTFVVGGTTILSVPVTINPAGLAGEQARLRVFADWDGNGSIGAGEVTSAAVVTSSMTQGFSLAVPNTTMPGTKYLRLRIAEGTLAPAFEGVNATQKGEVEDYAVTVQCPSLTLAAIPDTVTVGTAYSASATVTNGGTLTFSYSLQAGAPAWLSITSGGVLSGTPPSAGTFNFTVLAAAQGGSGCTGQRSYSLTVESAGPLNLTLTGSTPPGEVGVNYAGSVSASGGTPPYFYSLAATPASGLVAWWGGDNSAGDYQNAHHGNVSGAVSYAEGQVGRAFSFNSGNSNVVSVPTDAALDPTHLTLEAWVFPTGLASNRAIIVKSGNSSYSNGYGLTTADTNRIRFWTRGVTAVGVTSTSALPLNTWTYVVGTYDGVAARLYINGVEVGSMSNAAGIAHAPNAALAVGRGYANTNAWAGRIDEAALYSRALTRAEITARYLRGLHGALPPGLGFNPTSGMIFGTPTYPGSFPFTGRVSDASGNLERIDLSITISPGPKLALVDWGHATAWGSNGFEYSGLYSPSNRLFPQTGLLSPALPGVFNSAIFGGIGVTLEYEASNAFAQGIVYSNYRSNNAVFDSYADSISSNPGQRNSIRIAADHAGDNFGNNDGITHFTIRFDQPVNIQDLFIGSIDTLTSGGGFVDILEIRAFDALAGGNAVMPSTIHRNPLSLAVGDLVVDNLPDGRRLRPGLSHGTYAASVNYMDSAVRRIDFIFYGADQNTFAVEANQNFSIAIAGFCIVPAPEVACGPTVVVGRDRGGIKDGGGTKVGDLTGGGK